MSRETCYCPAYKFPHRMGGGTCAAVPNRPICDYCLQPCDVHMIDYGIGRYDYGGRIGTHTDWERVSDCCESGFIDPSTGEDCDGEVCYIPWVA